MIEKSFPEVEIDDLFSVAKSLPLEARSDIIHFNTEYGIKMLGDAVIDSFIEYL